jgi:dipeptidyl aminopeptidase/acylaminoacyl peptidase
MSAEQSVKLDGSPAAGASQLVRYELATGQKARIEVRDEEVVLKGQKVRARINAIPANYRWSPRGQLIAFTAPLGRDQELNSRVGVQATVQQVDPGVSGVRNGLFVLDISTGKTVLVSTPTLHVMSFDWSPDERFFVVSAAPDADGIPSERTDLFVVRRADGSVRALVTSEGSDNAPSWSPDGNWIAFSGHFGENNYHAGWPGVVAAAGGEPIRLGGPDDPTMSPGDAFWLPDSTGFLYSSAHHLVRRRILANLGSRRLTPVMDSADDYYEDTSLSADGRWFAYTRESLTTPPDLYIRRWPDGVPLSVTRFSQEFDLSDRVRMERVSWPSPDGKFTIHGMLLTPRESGDGRVALPTLVCLFGGPGMVRADFGGDGLNGGMFALAARGYAVLAPNTRGRGGYGLAFHQGIRTGRSVYQLPSTDALAGVDMLVQRGIADPSRLGVYGHSYGATLTAYMITRTTRFRAAVVHEGSIDELLTHATGRTIPGTDYALLLRDMSGIGIVDPFDPVEQARILDESPLLNMHRVQTPTLLHYGLPMGRRSQAYFFNALQRFGVPSELRMFDEGHVFARPAAIADDLAHVAIWFDFWLRGFPYPDTERAERYRAWQTAREWTPTRSASEGHRKP